MSNSARRALAAASLLLAPLAASAQESAPMRDRIAQYTPVRLSADLSALSPRERQMIPLLVQAAREHGRRVLGAVVRQPRLAARGDRRPGRAALRRDQLRAVGPAATTTRRSSPASGRSRAGANFYPARPDEGGVRGGRSRRAARTPTRSRACTRSFGATPNGRARRRSVPRGATPTRTGGRPRSCARPPRSPTTPGSRST